MRYRRDALKTPDDIHAAIRAARHGDSILVYARQSAHACHAIARAASPRRYTYCAPVHPRRRMRRVFVYDYPPPIDTALLATYYVSHLPKLSVTVRTPMPCPSNETKTYSHEAIKPC